MRCQDEKVKYYEVETGAVVKLEDGAIVYTLDRNGNWIHNQYYFSLFVDSMDNYWPISEAKVNDIIEKRKGKGNRVHGEKVIKMTSRVKKIPRLIK